MLDTAHNAVKSKTSIPNKKRKEKNHMLAKDRKMYLIMEESSLIDVSNTQEGYIYDVLMSCGAHSEDLKRVSKALSNIHAIAFELGRRNPHLKEKRKSTWES